MSDRETEEVKALANEASRQKQDRLRIAYQDAFVGESGTMVLEDLSKSFHVFSSCHEPGDSHGSALFEGQRQVVIHILSMLRPGPNVDGGDGLSIEQAEENLPSFFGIGGSS